MGFLDHGYSRPVCSNESCVKNKERRGGTFRLVNGKFYCEDCAPWAGEAHPGKELWNFTTTHFTGQPIHVQGRAHLHQLEKQYGCSNHAAHHMEKNWGTPPPKREAPMSPHLANLMRER